MKKKIFYFCLFSPVFLFAQTLENDSIIQQLTIEEKLKIRHYIADYYIVPDDLYSDSASIQIKYSLQFDIEKSGKISNLLIVSKNYECPPCEKNIYNVFQSFPGLTARDYRYRVNMPFQIRIEN